MNETKTECEEADKMWLAGRYYLHRELRTEIPPDSNGSNHPPRSTYS